MKCWLMKTEPGSYAIGDLKRDKKTHWEGVRNYQARNFMREMKKGDCVLFYHSNAEPSGVTGLAEIVGEAYPDRESWNEKSKYFDPKSFPDNPRWFVVDIAFVKEFPNILSLTNLKANPKLKGMLVLQKGSRLSVQPVSKEHYEVVCRMAGI